MALALFDMDKTLISVDAASLWCDYLWEKGIVDAEFIAIETKMMEDYDRGKLNMTEYMQFVLAPFKGTSFKAFSQKCLNFAEEKLFDKVFLAARESLNWHRKQKNTIIIVSATMEPIVKCVAEYLEIDNHFAINIEVDTHNRITGNTTGILTFQEGKVERLKQWLKQQPSSVTLENSSSYSDSINDMPLLSATSKAFAVNPDEHLKATALHEGWQVLNW